MIGVRKPHIMYNHSGKMGDMDSILRRHLQNIGLVYMIIHCRQRNRKDEAAIDFDEKEEVSLSIYNMYS